LRCLFEVRFIAVTENRDGDHRQHGLETFDGDAFKIVGEIGERVDFAFHFVENFFGVFDLVVESQRCDALTFGDCRIDLLDAFHIADGFLDLDRDSLLDLLRLHAGMDGRDDELVRAELRKHLANERQRKDRPAG
jgi:hypothetical protein